jgi:guanidinopropionase
VDRIFQGGTRQLPYAGIPTFLSAPAKLEAVKDMDLGTLQVGIAGIPMDLGVSNRTGARFGPRAVRTIERIGPYNAILDCMPVTDLKVADVGDVPFRSRFSLQSCHEDIEAFFTRLVDAGVAPLSVGGDHSVTHPVLRAVGRQRPVGLVHFDAHCDTGGAFDGTKFHHGGPFRNAVLEGVADPARCIQIGIRGSSEYLWEFSKDAGMTVISMDEFETLGCEAVIRRAREVVGDAPVYVTFDVDCLDPTFAPGTGTPEIGGLTTREVLRVLHGLKGINVVGGDVVEIAPQYDPSTNTAQAGAQVLFEILSLMVFSPSIGKR